MSGHKPNTRLPKSARRLKPELVLTVGNWVEQTFDAEVWRYGVRWLRVKGGFGDGQYPREDWIAEIPAVAISVHDYHWNGDTFGDNYGTFDNACKQELKKELQFIHSRIIETEEKLAAQLEARRLLTKAFS